MRKKAKIKKGSSFLEAIISVFLLSTGIIAVLELTSSNFQTPIYARDQLIAVFLAQEGVELVRNIRDNNWADAEGAFEQGDFPNQSRNYCTIERNSDGFINCSNNDSDNTKLHFDAEGFYVHTDSGNDSSKFKRAIQIKYLESDGVTEAANKNQAAQACITSVVIWKDDFPSGEIDSSNCNAGNQCVFSQTTLTKWAEM